ncbi:MAG: hypothetical protein K0R65_2305 [Crocinitomicaceae bacterium]|jgi:CysZ protein|nr:hypothetical protein [Crocinitomicaceae bacterium]
MKAINDHIYAINVTFRELGKGKFWLYLIPSLAVGLLFFIFAEFVSGMFSFVDKAAEVPLVGSYLNTGVEASKGFFSYIGDFFYQFVILTILSPVYCLLSEKVDNELSGANFSGGIVRILTDLLRMIFIVIISTLLYFTVMGAWWIISWFIGIELLDEIMSLLIGAFFLGFSFYDYSLERYQIGTWKSWMFSFENMGHMLLTGLIFNLLFHIPLIGVIISPFLATIISTAVFLKMHNKISIDPNRVKNETI